MDLNGGIRFCFTATSTYSTFVSNVSDLRKSVPIVLYSLLQEIKNNAAAYFQAQNRAVTKDDYMVRALSLPQRFGNIAKVYVVQDEQLNQAEENVQDDTAAEQQTFGQQVDESSNVDVVKQQRTTEAGGGY